MENLTPDRLLDALVVILAIFAAVITIDKVLDIVKKWKKPAGDFAEKLNNDKTRLDAHEDQISALKEYSKVQCSALIALLDHELHNGNADQMQKARDELSKYLQGLLTR